MPTTKFIPSSQNNNKKIFIRNKADGLIQIFILTMLHFEEKQIER